MNYFNQVVPSQTEKNPLKLLISMVLVLKKVLKIQYFDLKE